LSRRNRYGARVSSIRLSATTAAIWGTFRKARHAAAAMYRIAGIYHHHGDLDPAQAYYLRLIDTFPQTPTADEARLAVFNLLVGNNRATEAMSLAPRLLDGEPGLEVRWILWRKLVDLHHGIGDDAHVAFYAYYLHTQGPIERAGAMGNPAQEHHCAPGRQ
jgi:predicted Zn-dependent protease